MERILALGVDDIGDVAEIKLCELVYHCDDALHVVRQTVKDAARRVQTCQRRDVLNFFSGNCHVCFLLFICKIFWMRLSFIEQPPAARFR